MTPDAAGAALLALAAVPMTADGGFDGGVAGWLAGQLLPRLGVPAAPSFQSGATDLRLLAALAGAPEGESPVIDWEGFDVPVRPPPRAVRALSSDPRPSSGAIVSTRCSPCGRWRPS